MRTHSRAGVNTHSRMYVRIRVRPRVYVVSSARRGRSKSPVLDISSRTSERLPRAPNAAVREDLRAEVRDRGKRAKHGRGSRLRGDVSRRDASRSNVALVSDLSSDHLLRETHCVFLSHLKFMHKVVNSLFYSI